MEWVETTGRSIEEAKEAGLDQLGVDEHDAEFAIVEEPKSGLFGRVRQEARVRTRVRPTAPRPKPDRRDRRRREHEGGARDGAPSMAGSTARPGASGAVARESGEREEEAVMSVAEQGAKARAFVHGLVEAFGAVATTEVEELESDVAQVRVSGEDLGLLIGPRGQTLEAVQELTRTVVRRGPSGVHVRVDIAGYQERRQKALDRFARGLAAEVITAGTAQALEPMNAADRKVVHDAVNTVEGARTVSEGEDPRRRVVILPDEG